jgi:hypothetical protein
MNGTANVLHEWKKRISRSHRAHNRSAAFYETWSQRLGIIATVLSTIVGTTVFATLQESAPHMGIKIILGVLSITSAVIAALQTYLRFPELAQKHGKAAIDFGGLRRRVESLETAPPSANELENALVALDEEWKAISEKSPIITQKLYDEIDLQTGERLQAVPM